MSSSIDYYDCPRCGGNAYREQDNRTCEVTYGCSNCSWKGEPVENNIKKYQKVTIGFVVQHYMLNEQGQYVCSWQSFEAADQVTREDDNGDSVQIDISKEVEQAMDMEQPAPEKNDTAPSIQITIAGGAVQSVVKPKGVSLEIRDYDTDGADVENNDIYKQDDEGDWYQRMFWDVNEMGE